MPVDVYLTEAERQLAGNPDASVLELGSGDFTLRLDIDDAMMVDLGDGDRISIHGLDPDHPLDRPALGELRAAILVQREKVFVRPTQ